MRPSGWQEWQGQALNVAETVWSALYSYYSLSRSVIGVEGGGCGAGDIVKIHAEGSCECGQAIR